MSVALEIKQKKLFAKVWENTKYELINAYSKQKDKKHAAIVKRLLRIDYDTRNQIIKSYYTKLKARYANLLNTWFNKSRQAKNSLKTFKEPRRRLSKKNMAQSSKKEYNMEEKLANFVFTSRPVFQFIPDKKELCNLILNVGKLS